MNSISLKRALTIKLCLVLFAEASAQRTRSHIANDGLRGGNINKPTHHPTFPDWGYIYESSANERYPTNFPTYGDDIHTDVPTLWHPDYDSPTLFPTTFEESDRSSCEGSEKFFQLDLAIDNDGHEVKWTLTKLPEEVMYQGEGYSDGLVYDDVAEGCLEPGDYEFTIYDSGGDGIKEPGYYLLRLHDEQIAGGSNFGYNETTLFTVLADGETISPSAQPTFESSTAPSIEDSTAPTTSPVGSSEYSSEDQFQQTIKHSHDNWVAIIDENFEMGFGYFVHEDTTAVLHEEIEGRKGVIGIQGDDWNSLLVSKTILVGEAIGDGTVHSKFKVVFSYYTFSMEINDGFCFDYSIDGGATWQTEKCFVRDVDFENNKWYDDVTLILEPVYMTVNSITLRIRNNGNSKFDIVMIDDVHLYDLHE